MVCTELSWVMQRAATVTCARQGGILVSARQSSNGDWMKEHLHGVKSNFRRMKYDVHGCWSARARSSGLDVRAAERA
jgi:hypothetical protein